MAGYVRQAANFFSRNLIAILFSLVFLLLVVSPRNPQEMCGDVSTYKKASVATASKVFNTTSAHTILKYAVFGSDTPDHYKYAFTLPLTVRSWTRIGFKSVVILVGEKSTWLQRPGLKFILEELQKLKAIIVFLNGPAVNAITLSQTSRMFVGNMLSFPKEIEDRTFLLTTDADLWPINRELYEPPHGKNILILNSACCGKFNHRGKSYTMYPMSSVGMSATLWRDVMKFDIDKPKAADILEYFVREFGEVSIKPVKKGFNLGWFQDQEMVSYRLNEWMQVNGNQTVRFVPRSTSRDRVDRGPNKWKVDDPTLLAKKNDAHLFSSLYKDSIWIRVQPFLKFLYSPQEYNDCENYRNTFMKVIHGK